MKMNLICCVLCAELLVVGNVLVVAQEPPVPRVAVKESKAEKATIIRPSGEFRGVMGNSTTREALINKVEALIVQSNVKKQIIGELKKEFDGTAKAAIPIHVFEVLLSEDFVSVVNPLSGSIEDHRHKVSNTLSNTLKNLGEQHKKLGRKKSAIDALAAVVVMGKDASGRELAAEEIASKKRVLRTLILHRKDKEVAIDECKDDITFYRTELVDLVRLERRLEGMSEEMGAHIERVMDALEHEHNTLVTQDVRDSQVTLRKVIDVLKARVTPDLDVVSTKRNPADRRDVGIHSAVEGLEKSQRPLSPEEERLVEEELLKAQQRLNGGGNAEAAE
jgi:RNase H-fold protein (predicted Holliday junction resolvase)